MRNILNSFRQEKLYLLKLSSFITSMFPLSIFLCLKYFKDYKLFLGIIPRNIFVNLFMGMEIIALIYVIYFYKLKCKSSQLNILNKELKDVSQERTNTSSYLLSNVLPVITLEIESNYNFIFVFILILLLGFMYIKNRLFFINPLYDIVNIKTYSGEARDVGSINFSRKTIISLVNIYEFTNNNYEAIEYGDILIVIKKAN